MFIVLVRYALRNETNGLRGIFRKVKIRFQKAIKHCLISKFTYIFIFYSAVSNIVSNSEGPNQTARMSWLPEYAPKYHFLIVRLNYIYLCFHFENKPIQIY